MLVFFDDILIYSTIWSNHLTHLHTVFDVLLHHQLVLKYSKCDFAATTIEYLGHIISKNEVAMYTQKVACMLQWPYPQSMKEICGFLRLTRYYHRFVKDYGVLAQPLTSLLKKNSFEWTETTKLA